MKVKLVGGEPPAMVPMEFGEKIIHDVLSSVGTIGGTANGL